MSFMTNSPISTAKLESSPPLPIEGARGLFSMSDGWYDIDDNGNVKKIVDTDISSTALGEGATALGLQNIAGCLGYYFTDIDFEHNRIVLSKDQGASPTESFEIDYEVGDIISIKNDREYVDCSIITEIKDNLIVVDALPFTSMHVKEKPAINDNAIYVAMKPDKGGVLITESSFAGGKECKALGALSIAIGNKNIATGYNAIALGSNTKALNWLAYTEGRGTIARSIASHVQGKYNIDDTENKYAHIVGNGKSDTERSNAHTVDWNGNAWFAGDVFAGSAYDKLATENWCNATLQQKISELVNSAPETLDTLNELAKALGDDPNFATTITNQIAKKTDKQDVENIIEAFVFPSILLQSPNGNKFKLTVSDNGTLSTELVEEVSK